MITAKISIDCPVALQKGVRKMAHFSSIPAPHSLTVCCEGFGQEKNVGTSFNDLKFSSFNILTSVCTLEDPPLLLACLLVCNTASIRGCQGSSRAEGCLFQTPGLGQKVLVASLTSIPHCPLPYGILTL